MKLKLCGIRRAEDISYVNAFPPDYIGFVFAKSKRQVSAEQAAALSKGLRAGIQTVGVFVNEPIEHLLQIAERARLDVLQLHGDEDAGSHRNPPAAYKKAHLEGGARHGCRKHPPGRNSSP